MSVEERLAALEKRVDELSRELAADQLSPGVFSLNAAGQIEEKLSGKLEAQGVVFQELEGAASRTQINWTQAGINREQIEGHRVGESHLLQLYATTDKTHYANLRMESEPGHQAIYIRAGAAQRLLLNDKNESEF